MKAVIDVFHSVGLWVKVIVLVVIGDEKDIAGGERV